MASEALYRYSFPYFTGVDDGAKCFEMSLRMLRQAEQDHISNVILTLHYKPMRYNLSPETMMEVYNELERKKEEAGIQIGLHLGNEIYYSSEIISALEAGRRVCSNPGTYRAVRLPDGKEGQGRETIRYGLLPAGQCLQYYW